MAVDPSTLEKAKIEIDNEYGRLAKLREEEPIDLKKEPLAVKTIKNIVKKVFKSKIIKKIRGVKTK